MKIKTIAFDADDTLWHNEWLYREIKKKLQDLLAPQFSAQQVSDQVDEVEIENLLHYGYGIKSFILSLIESALILTEGNIDVEKINQILSYAKEMLQTDVPLFDHAHETLKTLSASYDLMLVTKGENFEQSRKINRSGIRGYFTYIEIVAEKNSRSYLEILRKFALDPDHFLMVGNSLRSDILPVLEIGGQAVYIPYEGSWFHENQIDAQPYEGAYYQLEDLSQLPDLLYELTG